MGSKENYKDLVLVRLTETVEDLDSRLNNMPAKPTQRAKDELNQRFEELAVDVQKLRESPFDLPIRHRPLKLNRSQQAAYQKLHDSTIAMVDKPLDPIVVAQFATDSANFKGVLIDERRRYLKAKEAQKAREERGNEELKEDDVEVTVEEDMASPSQ